MATEHTLGPWTADIEEHQAGSEWHAGAISDENLRTIARVPQPEPHWDQAAVARTEANIRLIAAAPDLLAALLELAAFFEANEGHRIDSDPNIGALHSMVKTAVAKARGEAVNGC